jgi:hypothetical protein
MPITETKQTIHQRICAIMVAVEAISKGRNNTKQGYKFRGIDDVYNDIHPLLAANGVFSTSKIIGEKSEERKSQGGSTLIYRVLHIQYTFWGENGDSIVTEVIGEGMDSGDKASNKALAVGHKYAIMQLLSIPTEDAKDPENDTHDIAPRATRPAPSNDIDNDFPDPTPQPQQQRRPPAPARKPIAQSAPIPESDLPF